MLANSYYENFIKEYSKRTHRKLNVILTGGGMGVADILKFPGASKVINHLEIPYGTADRYASFEKLDEFGYCSKEITEYYANYLVPFGGYALVINAALQTDRVRKGKDRAFIIFVNKEKLHISVNLEEELLNKNRFEQDDTITLAAMSLILNNL